MLFFTIHGWEPEIARFAQEPELVGDTRARTLTGKLINTRIARKRKWAGESSILDPSDARILNHLLHGDGHVWSFDVDPYSSKGLGWSTEPALDAVNFKFGTSSMTAASAGTYTAAYTDATVRTILYWRRPNSGSFNHYAIVATGAVVTSKYKNGVTTAETVTNWTTVNANGSFALLGKNDAGANSIAQYDDVVVLPFAATAAQITAWAAQTRAWADLPALNIGGDAIENEPAVAIPMPGKIGFVRGHSPLDGTFKNNLQTVAFSFDEV